MFIKPSFKDVFGPEIHRNIVNRYGMNASQEAAIKEALMYALDMCIEFQQKSDGLLSQDWINHIASEVYDALNDYVFDIFMLTKVQFIQNVTDEIKLPSIQTTVNKYYNRI